MFSIALIFLAVLTVIIYAIRYGIGPTPTSSEVRKSLYEVMPRKLSSGTIYELGAGWGNLLFRLGDRYPNHSVVGIEVSPLPWLWTYVRNRTRFSSNVCVVRGDFFQADLSDATLVVCYLYPAAMERLAERFVSELKPGTIIITHTFRLPGWTPISTIHAQDLYRTPVYVYIR